MKTLNEIRQDLKEIRYYCLRKDLFDSVASTVGNPDICQKLAQYNAVIKSATPKLFDIYVSLYIKNFTQENLSVELGYEPDHIQKLNKKLLLFLQQKINEQEENK